MSTDNGGYMYHGSGQRFEVIWNGYIFEPQPDITTYELALATRAMFTMKAHINWEVIEELPQEAKRHFQKEA